MGLAGPRPTAARRRRTIRQCCRSSRSSSSSGRWSRTWTWRTSRGTGTCSRRRGTRSAACRSRCPPRRSRPSWSCARARGRGGFGGRASELRASDRRDGSLCARRSARPADAARRAAHRLEVAALPGRVLRVDIVVVGRERRPALPRGVARGGTGQRQEDREHDGCMDAAEEGGAGVNIP
eukprot:45372-Prymnesium_polylepis.1